MRSTKMIILLTLVALTASRTLEENGQTIGWGRKIATAEEVIGDRDTIADGKLVLEMAEEVQSLGLGYREERKLSE